MRNRSKTILPVLAAALLAVPAVLPQLPAENVFAEEITFIDDRHDLNVSFKGLYSTYLAKDDGDMFTITFRRELNADEDPETEDISNVDVDAKNGLKGYLPPGWYDVIGIRYHGSNPALNGQKIGISSLIRSYNDQPKVYQIAIGEQAVKALQDTLGADKVYVEEKGESPYTADQYVSRVEPEPENPEPPFAELDTFGRDTEAGRKYIEYLQEEGIVDENYEYTDKAKKLLEAEERRLEQSENLGAGYGESIPEGTDGADMVVTDPGSNTNTSGNTPEITPVEPFIGENVGSGEDYIDNSSNAGADIKEERFDQNNTAPDEKAKTPAAPEKSKNRVLSAFTGFLSDLGLPLLIAVAAYFVLLKRKK